jgi:hypothetical protein
METKALQKYDIPKEKLVEFCHRWRIVEMGFFGSILREDFGEESDVDVLVSFAPNSSWSLLDLVAMQDELSDLLGRKVDLVEREALRNPYRRKEILRTVEFVYAV